MEIRIPQHIFFDGATPVGTLDLAVPYGDPGENNEDSTSPTPFLRWNDAEAGEWVLFNYREITDPSYLLDILFYYQVYPYQVPDGDKDGKDIPGDLSDSYYKDDIRLKLSIKEPGGSITKTQSNALRIQYDTDAKLGNLGSYSATQSKYYDTSEWGPLPPSLAGIEHQYFYISYQYHLSLDSSNSQAFKLAFALQQPHDGELVSWRFGTSSWYDHRHPVFKNDWQYGTAAEFNQINGQEANWWDFPRAAKDDTFIGPILTTVYRYPRTLLSEDVEQRLRWYDGASNSLTVKLHGRQDAADSRSLTQTHRYTEHFFNITGDTHNTIKWSPRETGGLINRLENPRDKLPKQINGGWNITGLYWGWEMSQKGTMPWTAYLTDESVKIGGAGGTVLTSGDYQFTGINIESTITRLVEDPVEGYKQETIPLDSISFKIEYKDAAGWKPYGQAQVEIIEETDSYGNKNTRKVHHFTGDDSTVLKAVKAVPLPPGSIGVRVSVTGKHYFVRINCNLDMELLPSPNVLEAIKGKDSVEVFNESASRVQNPDSSSAYYDGETGLITRAGESVFNKEASSQSNDPWQGLITTYYRLEAKDEIMVDGIKNLDDALALNLLEEQRKAVFYDLLPPGTSVNLNNIYVRSINWTTKINKKVEIVKNFRQSGRDLLIVHVEVEGDKPNFELSKAWDWDNHDRLRTGFQLDYTLMNPWINISDYGPQVTNYAAYRSMDTPLLQGASDNGGHFVPPFAEIMSDLDLSGKLEPEGKNYLYASNTYTYQDVSTISDGGFSKTVRSVVPLGWWGSNVYTDKATVMTGDLYSYRLRLQAGVGVTAQDICFFDSLEEAGGTGAAAWRGILESVDVTQPMNKGVRPVIYYQTQPIDAGNPSAYDLGNGLWTTVAPADMSQVCAVAVDLGKDANGQPFQLKDEEALLIYLNMRAPEGREVVPGSFVVNQAAWRATLSEGGAASDIIPSGTASVFIAPPPLDLYKRTTASEYYEGDYEEGDVYIPVVYVGDTLEYELMLYNDHPIRAMENIVLEDTLPAGLRFNPDDISFVTAGDEGKVAGSDRISLTVNGRTLKFTISKLQPNEWIEIMVPTIVEDYTTPKGPLLKNIAKVIKVGDNDYDIPSDETEHQVDRKASDPPPPPPPPEDYPTLFVPVAARKALRNGSLRDGQFHFVLKDKAGKVLAEASNKQDGEIIFPDRSFSREVSNYIYTIEEKAGADANIIYDSTVYTLKVTTTASDGQLKAKIDVLKNGMPYAGDIVFTNQRKMPATGDQALILPLGMLTLSIMIGSYLLLQTIRKKRPR
ncbi:MAG: Spy0128 family protein [Christensenellales bacterium]